MKPSGAPDNYRQQVLKKLEALRDVLAGAAVGDFSHDVNIPKTEDEFTELYVGIQVMVEVVREQIEESRKLHAELAKMVAARTRELERSQSHLRSIVDYAPNYIHILDTDLTVRFINRTPNAELRAQVVGSKVGSFMPASDRKRVQRILQRVLKDGKPAQYEFTGLAVGGGSAWYRTSAGPIFTNGEATGIVLMTSDITEERNRMQALHEGKRAAESARIRDRALLNSIGEGLVVIDEKGMIASINPAGSSMLGYAQKELLGKWFPDYFQMIDSHGRPVDPLDRPSSRALASGKVVSETVIYRHKDGHSIPVALTISPVVIAGKPVGAVEVFRDLSNERALEQAKEEFVSLASHQLRTPATGVKAYISMLIDGYAGKLSERQREFLQKVYDTNERQLQIVNDMLNVARVDAGKITPQKALTDLKALLQDVIDEQRPTIRERQQDLEVTVPEGNISSLVDPQLIRMVLENLVSNASKYTPEGGLINVSLRHNKEMAFFCIRDTGVGIAKADIPKLFQRFSRLDNPLSAKRGGTGLGLYLAQNIVELHEGKLRVKSQLGKGTQFEVELPLKVSPIGSSLAGNNLSFGVRS